MVLVFNLLLDTFENANGGRVVVDTTTGTKSRLDHFGRGDQVVSKAVVKSTLKLEKVLDSVKESDVSGVEGVERLFFVVGGVATDYTVR